jgi:two-component system, chemotaxis family, chemotaxis protein CheY
MPKCICIVDDHLNIREMLRYALTLQGMEVVEAVDGADALEKIVALNIDLFLIDWLMPNMDGLEMLRRVRAMEAFTETPVVMISGRDDLEARNSARELGVLYWLKKPFRISELQMIVENSLYGV